MGFYAHSYESDFLILQKDFESLKKAVMQMYDYCSGEQWEKADIGSVLLEFGFSCDHNQKGDLGSVWYEDQKFYSSDVKTFFDVIAPFVVEGSYISFLGEDDCMWAYYFNGTTCEEYDVVVTYPGMPTGGPKKE